MSPILHDLPAIKSLASSLRKSRRVSQLDSPEEPQSWTIANALSDMEASMHKIIGEHLLELVESESIEQLEDALDDIREELRHILYHVRDTQFFSLIDDPAETGSS